jgi:hypothetical protein
MTLVICAWCRNAGQPSFLRETEPYTDDRISHGMCAAHEVEWRAQAAALPDRRAVKTVAS